MLQLVQMRRKIERLHPSRSVQWLRPQINMNPVRCIICDYTPLHLYHYGKLGERENDYHTFHRNDVTRKNVIWL